MDSESLIIKPATKDKNAELFIKTYPKTPSTTPIVCKLDLLFEKFNNKFFESSLSKPVLTLSEEGRRKAYGWFTTEKVWKDKKEELYYEINICPEHLNRPIEDVCETLLHEMIHLKNSLDEVQDCSRSGLYHNKKFKICAEKHGLNVVKTEKYGYAYTSLKPETLEFIKTLDLKNFDLFRRVNFTSDEAGEDTESEAEESPKSSSRKYVCPECNVSIRATRDVNIRCEDCDILYVKKSQ